MFSRIVGNDSVKIILRRLIANQRVPASLLLTGDDGIGKKLFALELARSAICLAQIDGEACGNCSACTRSASFTMPDPEDRDAYKRVIFSSHPDVGIVAPYKRNISVDAIRHLESEANFRPYEASARFFIIDEADKMNDPASNALLNCLEEPPETSHIFLTTSRPDSLLPTIRSRCQVIRFAPVSTTAIEEYLFHHLAFSHDEARLSARLSRGSIQRAVSLNVKKFRQRRDKMLRVLTSAIDARDQVELLKTSEELNDAKNKEHFEENLDTLQSLIHDVWLVSIGGHPDRIANTDVADQLIKLAQWASPSALSAWVNEINLLRENLSVNINRKIASDALFIGMTARA